MKLGMRGIPVSDKYRGIKRDGIIIVGHFLIPRIPTSSTNCSRGGQERITVVHRNCIEAAVVHACK